MFHCRKYDKTISATTHYTLKKERNKEKLTMKERNNEKQQHMERKKYSQKKTHKNREIQQHENMREIEKKNFFNLGKHFEYGQGT